MDRRLARHATAMARACFLPIAVALTTAGAASAQPAPRREPPPASGFACGAKRYCTQMTSCAEAMFHFQVCGLRRLDGDQDGVPCERVCGQGYRSTRRR
jgi:hypothetical protein